MAFVKKSAFELNQKQLDLFSMTASTIPINERIIVPPLNNMLNKVFEADCLEKMKEIPDKSIDIFLKRKKTAFTETRRYLYFLSASTKI